MKNFCVQEKCIVLLILPAIQSKHLASAHEQYHYNPVPRAFPVEVGTTVSNMGIGV